MSNNFILLAIPKCVPSDMRHFRRADSRIKQILLLGIFPIQGSNLPLLHLLHCKQILHSWAIKEAPESRRATHQIVERKFKVWIFTDAANMGISAASKNIHKCQSYAKWCPLLVYSNPEAEWKGKLDTQLLLKTHSIHIKKRQNRSFWYKGASEPSAISNLIPCAAILV